MVCWRLCFRFGSYGGVLFYTAAPRAHPKYSCIFIYTYDVFHRFFVTIAAAAAKVVAPSLRRWPGQHLPEYHSVPKNKEQLYINIQSKRSLYFETELYHPSNRRVICVVWIATTWHCGRRVWLSSAYLPSARNQHLIFLFICFCARAKIGS